jgi:AraC family transcriptional regulator, transcriptional activator of pobA
MHADAASLQVERFDAREVVAAAGPHRHDYHEVFWTREGIGRHLIDGAPSPVLPGTVTLVGRGQVHLFEHAVGLTGAVVRFGDELLHGGGGGGGLGARADPGWLLAGTGPGAGARTVAVPAEEAGRVEAAIDALEAEGARGVDARGDEIRRHLLLALLLWIERWHDAAPGAGAVSAEVALHRRFARVLERDFARHHDARHYADALGVPPGVLSAALRAVTGRPTKVLIADRVLLEAARLLRFTDLHVGEVAFRAGFEDRLYFSRAFKRRYGLTPTAYRAALRG